MQGCVGVKWNQRISTSQALQPTSQVRRGTCLDLDRTSHSRRCTAVCWPLRQAATLSQALQCLQNLHPKPPQLSGEPSLKNTTSFGIFLKFENEGATKHHHHHRTLVHIQPYTFSYRNALLRPQKNAQKSPIRDNTEKVWVLYLDLKSFFCMNNTPYQIIVADAADAVSVNFSGRCKFLQI